MKATLSPGDSIIPKSIHAVHAALHHVGRSLLRFLTAGTELYITTACDRHGRMTWRIYDPTTRRTITVGSEDEVRYWIDHCAS